MKPDYLKELLEQWQRKWCKTLRGELTERPQNIKHSAKYGHWQAEFGNEIGVKLHSAIHQQMIELGWLK